MRAFTLSLLLLFSSTALATEPLYRVIFVHAGELLGSEKRAIETINKALKKKHSTVAVAEATPAETTLAQAAFAGQAAVALAEWKTAMLDAVVAIEIMPPAATKEGRISKGVGNVVVWRPGDGPAIVYSERVDATFVAAVQKAEAWNATPFNETTAAWIDGLLTMARGK